MTVCRSGPIDDADLRKINSVEVADYFNSTGYLSIITVAELAAGQMRQEQEEEKVHQLLALFTHLALDFAIAWRGGEIRRQYHTRLADALIAVTALSHHLLLSTRNLQHFTPIEGLQVEQPYD